MEQYRVLDRCCDLVMRGGITSGVVYPPAICRIAERFHLVGVGGTSAGAIAAGVAAAAEYRRRVEKTTAGFAALEKLPAILADGDNLLSLFRPDKATAPLFRLAIDKLDSAHRTWIERLLWWPRAIGRLLTFKRTLRPFFEQGYGLCSGMANGNRDGATIEPLTEWLSNLLDDTAGTGGNPHPLTFGDLWRAPVPDSLQGTISGPRAIDFRAVTTSLTFGRPFELPFDEKIFAFDPDEWKALFPGNVMEYLIGEAEQIDSPSLKRDGKLPLPVEDKLPVIVAIRMSLSFPALFTMVPLYAVNYENPAQPIERVWFSDGGITSNFPVHRYDSLFPRWPTIAINLQDTGSDGEPTRHGVDNFVYLPKRPEDAVRDLRTPFGGSSTALGELAGLAMAIFRSAQNWHDNSFLPLPGYRDRVAEIWLKPGEGGLNLSMAPGTIEELATRGETAGIRLRERFDQQEEPAPMSWESHRWIRYRSGMAALMRMLNQLGNNVAHGMPGDPALLQLLSTGTEPARYKFVSDAQRANCEEATRKLLDLIAELQGLETCQRPEDQQERPFCGGPKPPISLGSRATM